MCGVATEIRHVSRAEVYNDVFEVTVARSTVEIMSHGYTHTPEMMSQMRVPPLNYILDVVVHEKG
jgi:hypothetical protein